MIFDRFESLIGEQNLKKLAQSSILVFGLGGVGGHVVETLVRSGVGHITIIDSDIFEETNINRQIGASISTLGKDKVDVIANRCRDINPSVEVTPIKMKFDSNSILDFHKFDYIIDAVDDVDAKVEIIKRAQKANKKIISCMGTAKKFDPLMLKVSILSKTSVCPLASVMRKKIRDGEIKDCMCVFSTETPCKSANLGSTAFVPSVAGILIGKTVVLDLIKE